MPSFMKINPFHSLHLTLSSVFRILSFFLLDRTSNTVVFAVVYCLFILSSSAHHHCHFDHLVPDSATSAMSTPCSCAMKPRTENIAKPDTKLVPLFRPPSSKQSLCHTYIMEDVNLHRRNGSSHFFLKQPALTRVDLTTTTAIPPST